MKCYANTELSTPGPTSSVPTSLLSLSPFNRDAPARPPLLEGHPLPTFGPRGREPLVASAVPTSGCAHFSVGPGEAVEARGSDANGRTDLRPLDCGPGVHVGHIFQVPGTEADSVLSNKEISCWWDSTPARRRCLVLGPPDSGCRSRLGCIPRSLRRG